ncbi:chemotaxis protein CheW [Shewanella hanedai]|uniref:Chemotaxis protein CheW n=1 Tax=Shewanella hanedai TaxID=25 RepID=A0A553JT97_SHEHA|nr:chemotaxis protein CheW [Shewanella hanedai]TRY15674.1 chemotaxis protein CheW [Shewanella hanedai]GGI71533.1 chemotaxis protein CheW [Shewanella hanedai]
MSRLVDDAVLDYFSLLLTEDDNGKDESPIDASETISSDKFNQDRSEKLVSSAISISSREAEISVVDSSISFDDENEKRVLTQRQSTPKKMSSNELKEREPRLDKLALEQLLKPLLKSNNVKPAGKVKEAEVKIPPKVLLESNNVEPKVQAQTKLKSNVQELNEFKQALGTAFETKMGEIPPKMTKDLLETLDDEFQVLFFKVAGLTLAVPLVSLGGIVKLDRLNHIMGRPSWYKGVQTHRDSQLNVVDTCAWVMPEKYDDALAESVNYQYVVLLEDSNWGLTCESLVNSVKIMKSDVNWRSKSGKRPWLAGVVKEQMCGILHVHALIELLNSGLGSQDPVG